MRGEHAIVTVKVHRLRGSSPHARGALDEVIYYCTHDGIIPACAGSTVHHVGHQGAIGDHPRMRGEHRLLALVPGMLEGSSPHARGAHPGERHGGRLEGIIPACAGSTRRSRRCGHAFGDHPRMRGEHLCGSTYEQYAKGSSPHARGARTIATRAMSAGGIIPACAGSTNDQIIVKDRPGDHPRMRGEHKHFN